MSYRSPTANTGDQGPEERPAPEKQADNEYEADERNADDRSQNKGHGPLKGTDTAATTNAEDLEKAKRTTM
jgi:hypothetical protein